MFKMSEFKDFMGEKSRFIEFMVEKSGVEAWGWNVLQPVSWADYLGYADLDAYGWKFWILNVHWSTQASTPDSSNPDFSTIILSTLVSSTPDFSTMNLEFKSQNMKIRVKMSCNLRVG